MRTSSQRAWLGVAWAAAVIGLVLRARAATGDLWLDELWSLALVAPAHSPLDVFAKIHHDNNHYLNSLWLLAVGGGAAPIVYRLLSVVSGFALVALAVTAPFARTPAGVAATAVLLAGSRFLVQYGSEARGYGLAMLFALACFVSLDRFFATNRRGWLVGFSVTASLGLLSHLTFVFVLAAALVWAPVELARRRRVAIVDGVLLVTPALLVGLLWLVDLRFSEIGGAPASEVGSTVRELIRTTFGLPRGPLEGMAAVFLAFAAWELASLARERDSRVAFFAAFYLAPLLSLAVWRPDFTMPRYFAVVVPFSLLLVGAGLGRIAGVSRAGAALGALALAVFAAGNAVQVAALLRDGRGHYRDALALMLARSASHAVTIGGFNDFRNPLVLDDQVRRLGAGDRVTYTDLTTAPALTPDWVLVIDGEEHPEAPASFERAGRTYQLAEVFPYAGLSGWSWILYRLE